MNYFKQERAFYDRLGARPLSAGQISLWHALLNLCNRLGWPPTFTADRRGLSLMSGLSEVGVYKSLQVLESEGMLHIKYQKGEKTQFSLVNLALEDKPSPPLSVPELAAKENPPGNSEKKAVQTNFCENSSNIKQIPMEKPPQKERSAKKQMPPVLPRGKRQAEIQTEIQTEILSGPESNWVPPILYRQDETKTKEGGVGPASEEILAHLNRQAGRAYRLVEANRKLINARLNEGFSVADFVRVVDVKCAEWKNSDRMRQYLRPETLFGNKFQSYLSQAENAGKEGAQNGGGDLPGVTRV